MSTASPSLVAVTGAGGLVGSAVMQELQRAGIPCVAVVRNQLSAAILDCNLPGVTVRVGSVDDPARAAAVLEGCDVVVNCAIAGSSGVPANAYSRNRAIVDGVLAAPAIRRLIHFSSVAVYGEVFAGIASSDERFRHPRPNSEYGRSKLDVERYALERAQSRGVGVTAVRLGHVYGPGVGRSREILELSEERTFSLPFDGRYPSNAVHIDLVASAIRDLIRRGTPSGTVNLVEPLSWRDVFEWHATSTGVRRAPAMSDSTSRRAQRALLERSVVRELVGWSRSLPIGSLLRSPTIFDSALRVLAHTPPALTRKASRFNRRFKGGKVSGSPVVTDWPPLYFSEGVPGPTLPLSDVPDDEATAARRRDEMRAWYLALTVPPLPA